MDNTIAGNINGVHIKPTKDSGNVIPTLENNNIYDNFQNDIYETYVPPQPPSTTNLSLSTDSASTVVGSVIIVRGVLSD